MMNPRTKHDVLWELSLAAISFGRECEMLPNKPTIEDQKKAYSRWIHALADAHRQLDTKEETHV